MVLPGMPSYRSSVLLPSYEGKFGNNDIYPVLQYTLKDSPPVFGGLYRRIPCDKAPFFYVIFLRKPKLDDTSIRCDALLFQRNGIVNQHHFPGSADVKNKEFAAEHPCRCDHLLGCILTSLGGSGFGVLPDRNDLAMFVFVLFRIGFDNIVVFTVGGDQQFALRKYSFEAFRMVYQYFSCVGGLKPHGVTAISLVDFGDSGNAVLKATKKKGMTGRGLFGDEGSFFFQKRPKDIPGR